MKSYGLRGVLANVHGESRVPTPLFPSRKMLTIS
jgi:hypothetical protein